MKKYRAIVLGAGYRGRAYAAYAQAHPERLEIVGVADPVQAEAIAASRYWTDWRTCLEDRPEADLLIVALPDALHYAAAMRGLDLGYHVLLEKPIATTADQCREVIAKALAKKRLVMLGYVLRYTPYFAHIKAILDSGEIGDVVSIAHQESAGYWKIAHSFVRGNWSDATASTPIIVAKCSHDFDLFAWWLNRPCRRVTSFGSIGLFKPENRPAGAADRCVDCPASVERACIWSAKRMYLEDDRLRYLFADGSDAAMERVVRETRFGRCVFSGANNVPDHQTVTMEFEGGVTVSHVLTGLTGHNVRTTRISGTRGEIVGDGDVLQICRFDGGDVRTGVPMSLRVTNPSRHDGGDFNLMAEFLRLLDGADGGDEIARVTASALPSHLIGFAAEESRLAGGRVVELS